MDNTLNAPDFQAGFCRPTALLRMLAALRRGRSATQPMPVPVPVQRISKQATLRYPNLMGARIECLEGNVWVTLDGDCRDVVLRAGQSLLVDRPTPVLVHALADACTRVRPRSAGMDAGPGPA
ncbi:DUF2917 domain-containing protein [uncultured Ramlibacter sp.]|uniref:DUF2917 domain-containing protein n=1 Tax=uncultured Ramlibacter sp. TaxID=260755 RepID=UPI00262F0879|nr:DUF2917 domain-containing protein [uncultured Ramlibacter sp.]